MATLTNLKIKDTYDGLLKTSDNQPIGGTLKTLQDGLGNDLPLQVSTTEVNFTGTVSGITSGGLVAGTGANSMESALTTNPADARGVDDIVIGEGAQSKVDATFGSNVIIGKNATQTGGEQGIVIGLDATMSKGGGIAIGLNSDNNSGSGIAIGRNAETGTLDEAAAIGLDATATGNAGALAVGRNASATGLNPSAFGRNAQAAGQAVAVGYNAVASGNEAISIGQNSDATTNSAMALGERAQATLTESVALGSQVTAVWASGTTVNQFAIANYANINYADDAAAATGGVPLGGVYHTAGALKIRIA